MNTFEVIEKNKAERERKLANFNLKTSLITKFRKICKKKKLMYCEVLEALIENFVNEVEHGKEAH